MSDNARNISLLHRVQNGEPGALDEFTRDNMGLVRCIAARFSGRGVEYEDLVQIGCIGMIKAAKSFDFSFNTAFSTYAVPYIAGEIRRVLRDDGPVKVPRALRRLSADMMRAREEFWKKEGREPRISELSAMMGVCEEDLAAAGEASRPVRSLYESPGNGEDGAYIDVLPESDDRIDALTDRLALREAVGALPELQRKIIILRYYKDLSQEATGRVLGISQVKVSREEKKTLEELRRRL